jgi:hypothetical protein
MQRRFGILALLVALLPACHHAPQDEDEPEMVNLAPATITIRVVNHSQLDATIYLVHDGTRDRLGAVTAVSAASFPVRTRMFATGDFTLVADPLGSTRTASSEPLRATQGSLFIWTLESDFAHNSVLVQE